MTSFYLFLNASNKLIYGQLGRLPDDGGGPRCPRRQEEPPSDPVGRWGAKGGGEVEVGQDLHPQGVAGSREGFPCLEGALGARIRGSMPGVSPAQLAQETCPALRPGPMPSRGPLYYIGSGGIGGRLEENRRGRRDEGALQDGGTGKSQRECALPTWAGKPAGLPGWVPCPPRTEARLDPFCCIQPKPHPAHGPFQPCAS